MGKFLLFSSNDTAGYWLISLVKESLSLAKSSLENNDLVVISKVNRQEKRVELFNEPAYLFFPYIYLHPRFTYMYLHVGNGEGLLKKEQRKGGEGGMEG